MTTPALVIFSIAAIVYVLTWVYIRQFIRDVNTDLTTPHVSVWNWTKGWHRHRIQFPDSPVRKRILTCIAATVTLGLVAFVIQARYMFFKLIR